MPPFDEDEFGFNNDFERDLVHLTQIAEKGLDDIEDGLRDDQPFGDNKDDDEDSSSAENQNPGDNEGPGGSESDNQISRNNNRPDGSEANEDPSESDLASNLGPGSPGEGNEDISPSRNRQRRPVEPRIPLGRGSALQTPVRRNNLSAGLDPSRFPRIGYRRDIIKFPSDIKSKDADDFLSWFRRQDWFYSNIVNQSDYNSEKTNQVLDRVFRGARRSECWSSFDQGADVEDGTPRLVCRHCKRDLHHVNFGKQGTSALSGHLDSMNCRKRRRDSGGRSSQPGSNPEVSLCNMRCNIHS